MGLIREFLFGRQVKIKDEKIGELTINIRSANPSLNYTWVSEFKLNGQGKPTVFILEGNSVGPHSDQLKCVYRIVDTLDNIIAQVDKELKGRVNIKQKFKEDWTKYFHLAAVTPYDPDRKDDGKQFELTFESIKDNETDYIGLLWNNGRLTEIEAK